VPLARKAFPVLRLPKAEQELAGCQELTEQQVQLDKALLDQQVQLEVQEQLD
jgi:hypothetical protein